MLSIQRATLDLVRGEGAGGSISEFTDVADRWEAVSATNVDDMADRRETVSAKNPVDLRDWREGLFSTNAGDLGDRWAVVSTTVAIDGDTADRWEAVSSAGEWVGLQSWSEAGLLLTGTSLKYQP